MWEWEGDTVWRGCQDRAPWGNDIAIEVREGARQRHRQDLPGSRSSKCNGVEAEQTSAVFEEEQESESSEDTVNGERSDGQ